MFAYQPLQPTVNSNLGDIIYQELQPPPPIDEYVYCYWELSTVNALQHDFIYKVVSDGCIDVFFNAQEPSLSFVTGFYQSYTEFNIGNVFKYYGIRFLPSYFTRIFKIDAIDLSDQTTPLEQLIPKFAQFITESGQLEKPISGWVEVLDKFLGQWVSANPLTEDLILDDALQIIFQREGCLEIEKHLNTGLSPRQLRRVFNKYIGTTPKSFSQVVRFQSVIRRMMGDEQDKLASIYLNAGFSDQAHFIKDFKRFYGVTPGEVYL